MVEEYVRVVRELSTVTTPVGVHCRRAGDHLELLSHWEHSDLQRSEKVVTQRSHIVETGTLRSVASTLPVELHGEQLRAYSKDGRFAVLRKVSSPKQENEKQYIEIWEDSSKVKVIDACLQEKHLNILADGQFGCLEWSPSGQHLLYVAEQYFKAESCFKADPPSKQDFSSEVKHPTAKGDEFAYRQSWGEALQKVHHPLVFVLDVETEEVAVPGITPDVSCGQATWTPDGRGVVFVGWWHQPFRLGLIYCGNRKSALFHTDLKTKETSIIETAEDFSVEFPRFSPDGRHLVFFSSPTGGPHRNVQSITKCEWPKKTITTVVDYVTTPAGPSAFPGIYVLGLPRRLWMKDSEHLIVHSIWRSKQELLCVAVNSGRVDRLTNDAQIGNWELLDCFEDVIVAAVSAPNLRPHLVVGRFSAPCSGRSIDWLRLDGDCSRSLPISWETCDLIPPSHAANPKYPDVGYDAVLVEPSSPALLPPHPLIVLPHGGPHSTLCASYLLPVEFFTRLGFAVVFVNYRGSLGFGRDSVDSLLGNIGTQDVADVQFAVKSLLKCGRLDCDRMVLYGGSHGGFLVLNISGLYPDMYKACVARNPVVDLTGLVGLSDIPDWCFVEDGSRYDHMSLPDPETMRSMWQKSPIRVADRIRIPVLFLLGSLDLRVPHQQGLLMYKALKARGINTRVYLYNDNHALKQVVPSSDSLVHTADWLMKSIS